nr:hypothetical protein CFP56_12354 [Quercus suber]
MYTTSMKIKNADGGKFAISAQPIFSAICGGTVKSVLRRGRAVGRETRGDGCSREGQYHHEIVTTGAHVTSMELGCGVCSLRQ